MLKLFYDSDYTLSAHAFETTRKAAWIADSLEEYPLPRVLMKSPSPLRKSDLLEVHSAAYVTALETGEPRDLAQSQGLRWDESLFPMVLSTNGGVLAAAEAALRDGIAGSLSTGLHHARRSAGNGFCSINGLAIAANKAVHQGCKRVLILDLDAHCGGGTSECIANDPHVFQLDISVHPFDRYASGNNSRLVMIDQGVDYLTILEYELEALGDSGDHWDLCLYNAGMDPYEHCPHGGMEGVSKRLLWEREQMVFRWCSRKHIPVAVVIAGGYLGGRLERQDLIALHRMTIEAALQEWKHPTP
jgi:acetoin utilization deacetylase AcuC-like enzyme